MKSQRGFTLVELAVALGIVGTISLIDAQQGELENRQIKARGLGQEIFQYNVAVGRFLADHGTDPDLATGTYTGTAWLKSSACHEGTAAREYLTCDVLPGGETQRFRIAPETTITQTLSGGLEARTVWGTALAPNGGPDGSAMGIAAMVASGSYVSQVDNPGGSFQGPTVFCPDIDSYAPAIDLICSGNKNKIVSLTSTDSRMEEWLRVDHGNTAKHAIEFDNGSGNPSSDSTLEAVGGDNRFRQIANVARIYNVGDVADGEHDALIIGSRDGNAIYANTFLINNDLLNNAVIVDGNNAVIGDIYARADAYVRGNLVSEVGDIATVGGDVRSGGDFVAANNITVQNDITAQNGEVISTNGNLLATSGIIHADTFYGRVLHDSSASNLKADGVTPKDFTSPGYILNPDGSSRLNTVHFMDESTFRDYIQFSPSARMPEEDTCGPTQTGMLTTTPTGKILSCVDGHWIPPAASGGYAYFNSTSCPEGWTAANGTNGTVDLRGKFIRSWNPGSGLDSGRTVGDTQNFQTYLSRAIYKMNWGFNDYGRTDYGESSLVLPRGLVASDDMFKNWGADKGDPVPKLEDWRNHETRPTNVALLTCMKL